MNRTIFNEAQLELLNVMASVKDDIEYGYLNVIPLWAFGLLY